MEHLTVEDLLSIAEEVLGASAVRDVGLLDSAAHRPQASVFGQDAYPTIHEKAAALLDAVVRHHALVDGNKRLGWAATVVFYDLNGLELAPPSADEAVELVVAVASGHLELGKLCQHLASWTHPR
jgi:death on curing protein